MTRKTSPVVESESAKKWLDKTLGPNPTAKDIERMAATAEKKQKGASGSTKTFWAGVAEVLAAANKELAAKPTQHFNQEIMDLSKGHADGYMDYLASLVMQGKAPSKGLFMSRALDLQGWSLRKYEGFFADYIIDLLRSVRINNKSKLMSDDKLAAMKDLEDNGKRLADSFRLELAGSQGNRKVYSYTVAEGIPAVWNQMQSAAAESKQLKASAKDQLQAAAKGLSFPDTYFGRYKKGPNLGSYKMPIRKAGAFTVFWMPHYPTVSSHGSMSEVYKSFELKLYDRIHDDFAVRIKGQPGVGKNAFITNRDPEWVKNLFKDYAHAIVFDVA